MKKIYNLGNKIELTVNYNENNIARVTKEFIEQTVIPALEKQIPKKPYMDNENGIYEQECCPTCNRHLFPNEHHCRCGQAIDWSESNG